MSALDEYKKSKTAFDAIPTGTYDATIVESKEVDFGGANSKYSRHKAQNIQLRITEDSPVGAKRVFFLRVPKFERFLPSEKNPQGALAFGYFQFAEAIGLPDEQVKDGYIPPYQTYAGKRVTVRIKYFPVGSDSQEFHVNKETGEDEAWNEVDRIFPARPGPAAALAPPADLWSKPAAPVADGSPVASSEPAVTSENLWGSTPDPVLAGAVAESKGF